MMLAVKERRRRQMLEEWERKQSMVEAAIEASIAKEKAKVTPYNAFVGDPPGKVDSGGKNRGRLEKHHAASATDSR